MVCQTQVLEVLQAQGPLLNDCFAFLLHYEPVCLEQADLRRREDPPPVEARPHGSGKLGPEPLAELCRIVDPEPLAPGVPPEQALDPDDRRAKRGYNGVVPVDDSLEPARVGIEMHVVLDEVPVRHDHRPVGGEQAVVERLEEAAHLGTESFGQATMQQLEVGSEAGVGVIARGRVG